MATNTPVTYFLPIALVVCFYITTTGAAIHVAKPATVTVTSKMAETTEPFALRCKSKDRDIGGKDMDPGSEYRWTVKPSDHVFTCGALWGRWFASWSGFDQARDGGLAAVFWVVKRDGVFRSWGNSTWTKEVDWGN